MEYVKKEIVSDLQKEYSIKATFSQDLDCQDSGSDDEGYQFLTMETVDEAGEEFFIMGTRRWAFDDIQEVIDLLEEFKEKHKTLKK
jgi:hypothetical protein